MELTKIRFNLYTSVLTANLATITVGTAVGWTSPAFAKFKEPQNNPLDHALTTVESSIIASIQSAGVSTGALISGYSSDKFGRKLTITILTLCIYLGYLIIAFGSEAWHFYIARYLCGISHGTILTVLPIYVAEISLKHNRGLLSCLLHVNHTLGKFLMFAAGPYITIQQSGFVCLAPATLFFLSFAIFAPESPIYKAAKGDVVEAQAILEHLRRGEAKNEMQEIQIALLQKRSNIVDLFGNRIYRKMFVLPVGLLILRQFAGINAILYYLQGIFQASGSTLPADVSSIIIGLVQFVASSAAIPLVDRAGRRLLLLISSITCLVALVSIGLFFYFKDEGDDMSALYWLPITSLIIFIIGFSLGLGPIPFVLLGEVFPPHLKAVASTCSIFTDGLFTFLATLSFPYMMEYLGVGQTFWCLAVMCAISFAFVYFCVPETKGKSLSEINQMFNAM